MLPVRKRRSGLSVRRAPGRPVCTGISCYVVTWEYEGSGKFRKYVSFDCQYKVDSILDKTPTFHECTNETIIHNTQCIHMSETVVDTVNAKTVKVSGKKCIC